MVVLVAAEDPIFLGDAYHPVHAGKLAHVVGVQRRGVADQVDFGEHLFLAANLVNAMADAVQALETVDQTAELGAFGIALGVQYQDHSGWLTVAVYRGATSVPGSPDRFTRENSASRPHWK